MGNVSINLSLANIWKSWYDFKKGKNKTSELECFTYFLENNLYSLFNDLNNSNYKHGDYKKFVVCDNKRREISVASIRDRVVHRLVYNFLTEVYDKKFIFDLWSNRKNKGLVGAIKRTSYLSQKYKNSFIWRADIKKFFDNVNQAILIKILKLKINQETDLNILKEIISSYSSSRWGAIGLPIGNLTSQIFSNIYLNEFDRFIKHTIKPLAYLRYGDDFIIFSKNSQVLTNIRQKSIIFLEKKLNLKINDKNDVMIRVDKGIRFLGVIIYPYRLKLNKRNQQRVFRQLNLNNYQSYYGLIKQFQPKTIKEFYWYLYQLLNK